MNSVNVFFVLLIGILFGAFVTLSTQTLIENASKKPIPECTDDFYIKTFPDNPNDFIFGVYDCEDELSKEVAQ